jgi:hypothetical protein
MNRRTLFERSELGRPPKARVRPILMRPDGASMVLGPFPERKGPRLPGRDPAIRTWRGHKSGEPMRCVHLPAKIQTSQALSRLHVLVKALCEKGQTFDVGIVF